MYYILQCNEERLEFVWIGTCGSEQKRRGNHGYARLCQSNKRFCPLFEPLLNVDPRCVSSRRASQLPHLEHLQRETERRWMGWMGVRPPEVCEASWRWNKAKWNHWVLHVSFLRWCLSGLWWTLDLWSIPWRLASLALIAVHTCIDHESQYTLPQQSVAKLVSKCKGFGHFHGQAPSGALYLCRPLPSMPMSWCMRMPCD